VSAGMGSVLSGRLMPFPARSGLALACVNDIPGHGNDPLAAADVERDRRSRTRLN
jgi:hypothetical protein